MAERQLEFFSARKPLLDRLGHRFFQAAPRGPGVYVMTGPDGRVLYVGQSVNLRSRLGSYKNARAGKVTRKVLRLAAAASSITWETCRDAEAARLRENELLRLHRPQFNTVNTFPAGYQFVWLRFAGCQIELGVSREAVKEAELFGAFKGMVGPAVAALMRLLWASLRRADSHEAFPLRLLGAKAPPSWRFELTPGSLWPDATLLNGNLRSFFAGTSAVLLDELNSALPSSESLSAFQRAFFSHDLELLRQFYLLGPRRNLELRQLVGLQEPLIPQERLDDLLAMRFTRKSHIVSIDQRPRSTGD